MYCVVIKKNKGDVFPYGVNELIRAYINLYGKNDVLIAYPGYQSVEKTKIDDLCKELKRIAPNNKIYFANGMNGKRPEKTTGKTVHDCHIPTIDPKIFGHIDHSKCIVFTDEQWFTTKNPRVKALLIGSSNISFNTYVRCPAEKGETDVLLFVEEAIGFEKGFKRIRNYAKEEMSKDDKKVRCLYLRTLDDENHSDSQIIYSFLEDIRELSNLKDFKSDYGDLNERNEG